MALQDEKYLAFTTFRRDGRPVTTTIWIADLGHGSLGFWTSSKSGKAKRLRHTARVLLQPANGRGVVTPGTQPIEATARLVTGPELEDLRARIVAKYGFMAKLTKLIAKTTWAIQRKPMPYADIGVVVDLTIS